MAAGFTGFGRAFHAPEASGSASELLRVLAKALTKARTDSPDTIAGDWNKVANFFWAWDAAIQDALVARPAVSAAYQLGRGFSEVYWALDSEIEDEKDMRSAGLLLGSARGRVLDGLLSRLVDYYDPIARHALSELLRSWRELVAREPKRPPGASVPKWLPALADQAVIWRDLIVGDRDGESLVSPAGVLGKPGQSLLVLRHFFPEAVALVLGSSFLLMAAHLLVSPQIQAGGLTVSGVPGV